MYEETLNEIKKKLKNASLLIDKIEDFKDDDAFINEDISNLINTLSASVLKAKELPRELGIIFDYDAVSVELEVEEKRDENGLLIGYHFILPSLLDKRDNNSAYSKTRELTKQSYAEAFERYSDEKGFAQIHEKVRIEYVNHFKNYNLMIDNDNIDTKGFTDLITMHILDDDDPLRTELCIRGVVDGNSFTEVFVKVIEK